MTETSIRTRKELEALNDRLMNDRGIASYFLSLSKITNPENTNHFKIVKDSDSNRVNDLLIHNTIPITLINSLSTFRDTCKELELKGDPLKIITNINCNVDLASLSERKLKYDFAKEMNFQVETPHNKSTRERKFMKFLKSPGLMTSDSGVSSRIFLRTNPNELCNRLKLLLQEKQAGDNSNMINDEIVAIVDKFLKYKRISKQKQILINCNLLHTKEK